MGNRNKTLAPSTPRELRTHYWTRTKDIFNLFWFLLDFIILWVSNPIFLLVDKVGLSLGLKAYSFKK